MKRLSGFLLGVAAAGLLFGCGDNSKECGSNTTDEDGVCVGTGSGEPPTCTGGTILDTATNSCVIDPAACQDGTVLMDGACVDEGTVTADVTEAAEPNALGIGGEDSDAPAGVFDLGATGGDAVVLTGNIDPHPDANEDGRKEADFDTYLFEANAPTVLEISVDGVGGIAGGFALLADDASLGDYLRFGVNLTGDTANRQVFLPKAGVYALAIADTRTLRNGDAVGDADSKYYVSIKNLGIPTATAITLTAGVGTANGTISDNEVDVFTAPLGTGFNTVTYQSYDEEFDGSIVAIGGGTVHALVDEVHSTTSSAGSPANLVFGGVTAAETPYIVVDHVMNTGAAAVDYRLNVTSRTATALKTDGTTATADLVATAPVAAGDYTYFYFDAVANQTLGMNLTFNTAVKATIVDSAGVTAAALTGLTTASPTFLTYKGLLRFPATGRYYVRLLKPAGVVGDDIIATSKIAAVTPAALTFGTPVVAATPSADFGTTAFTYALNASFWQQFSLTANAASGGAYVRIIDSRDAYGRLDDLTTSGGLRAPTIATLEMIGAPATTEVQGFIPAGFGPSYFITVSTDTGIGAFDFGVAARAFTDLGNHAAPYTAAAMTTEALTNGVKRYYFRTTPGATVTIAADPAATLGVAIEHLDYDEFVLDSDDGILGDDVELEVTANADGYVAFQVVDTGLVAGTGTYELAISATVPTAPVAYYTAAAGTTAWTNICAHPTATDITPANRDDGLSVPVAVPAGFTLYGAAVTSATVSTNGYLTFASGVTTAPYFQGQRFPSAAFPAQTVAPFFGDLGFARVCSEVVGGKLIVQWRGDDLYEAGSTIAVQAILDPATDSIEFVYAPFHTSVVGVAGVQQSSTVGQELFYIDETTVHAGTSIKLTHL